MYIRYLGILCLVSFSVFNQSADSSFARDIKILILGGIPGSGGQPSPVELRPNVDFVKSLPADGLVINLTNNKGFFADFGFGVMKFSKDNSLPRLYTAAELQKDKEIYNNLDLGKTACNFARLNIGMLPDFKDHQHEWEIICKNTELAAKTARDCGLVGFLLDTEMYHYPTISPFQYKGSGDSNFLDYRKFARIRGRQFMAAINSKMPNAKIIITFASSSVLNPQNHKQPEQYNCMALVPAFIDGLLDAATPINEFIDGYENSYYFKSRQEFADARNFIKNDAAELSFEPYRYREKIKVGFGIFPHKSGAHIEYSLLEDPTQNSVSPEQLYDSIRWACEYSDGMVWLYGLPWTKMPANYLEQIKNFHEHKTEIVNTVYYYYAKDMIINNNKVKNWWRDGDYISITCDPNSSDSINSTGTVELRPNSDAPINNGIYEVLFDIQHANIKKQNSGTADRNGSFAYGIKLTPQSTGSINFLSGSSPAAITYYPNDNDNCNPGGTGPVALMDFEAYGSATHNSAKGYIELQNVKQSDLVFAISDNVSQNYGYIGIKSIRLVMVSPTKP